MKEGKGGGGSGGLKVASSPDMADGSLQVLTLNRSRCFEELTQEADPHR